MSKIEFFLCFKNQLLLIESFEGWRNHPKVPQIFPPLFFFARFIKNIFSKFWEWDNSCFKKEKIVKKMEIAQRIFKLFEFYRNIWEFFLCLSFFFEISSANSGTIFFLKMSTVFAFSRNFFITWEFFEIPLSKRK